MVVGMVAEEEDRTKEGTDITFYSFAFGLSI